MIYALTLIDKPQTSDLRQRVRPEHKAYLGEVADRIAFAGPLTTDDGIREPVAAEGGISAGLLTRRAE